MPVDASYYKLLGVPPSCGESELRTAYKKKELLLHPDRGGNPADFQNMKNAYDVLSDPQRRKIYDSYGPEGLQLMDGDIRPGQVMKIIFRSGKCGMAFLTTSMMLFFILFAVRWDESAGYPWALAFIPFWLFHAVSITLFCMIVRAPPPEGEPSSWEEDVKEKYTARKRVVRNARLFMGIRQLLLVTSEVFLVLKLQGDVDFSWFIVLLPWILFKVHSIVSGVLSAPKRYAGTVMEAQRTSSPVQPPGYKCFVLQGLAWGVIPIITAFLAAAKAEDVLTGTWYIVLIPSMIGKLCNILGAIRIKTAYMAERRRRAAQSDQSAQNELQETGGVCTTCCSIGFWLAIACTGASKLDGADYSAFVVFIPLFALFFFLFCVIAWMVMKASLRAAPPDGAGGVDSSVVGATGPPAVSVGRAAATAEQEEADCQPATAAESILSVAEEKEAAHQQAAAAGGVDPSARGAPVPTAEDEEAASPQEMASV